MKVYRLITNRTYEMEMFQRANLKLGLDKAVLNPLKQNLRKDGRVDVQRMNKKEAETLLKYGAYDFFKEEREGRSEELSNAFCEADIDQILEKNAKVITVDSQGGSSFSKASFVTDTSAEVDINDPNFWTKVIGLKEQEEMNLTPRTRQTRYGAGKEEVEQEDPDGVVMIDENDWTKSDRDLLLRLLLAFGWGQWEPVINHPRLKKHPKASVQVMAISLIGQLTRAQRMIDENSRELKNGAGNGGVKTSAQAREAIEVYHDRYDVCAAVFESCRKSEAGDAEAVGFPHCMPLLVRDPIWWQREIKACDRHLKQLSFMQRLQQVAVAAHVTLGGTVALPVPRRAALPAPWWTMQDDYDALLGVLRHGWGNWKEICNDPELTFHKSGIVWAGITGDGPEANETPMEEEPTAAAGAENVEAASAEPPAAPAPAVAAPAVTPAVTPAATPTPATPTPTPQPVDPNAKLFPSASLLMKRLRRLVAAMEQMPGVAIAGGDAVLLSSKKRDRLKGAMIGEWSQNELRSLRSTILRWGLPLPPTTPALKPCGAETARDTFNVESLPLSPEQRLEEECLAGASTVLGAILQELTVKMGDTESVPLPVLSEEESLVQRDVMSRARYGMYPCSRVGESCELGLYSNPLGPFEFLRIQAKLKSKTTEMVQEMCRRMETRSLERYQQSREVHVDEDGKKEKEKEKEKEDTNDIIPSNIIAQRIYRRLQLYYDLQQYVWSKDERTQRAIIQKWQTDGPRRQDHLSEGWDPLVHDMALLRGVRKWGFVEWELLWSDPEMPFGKPENDKKKEDPTTPEARAAAEAAAAEAAAVLNAKTIDRSLIVGAELRFDVGSRSERVAGHPSPAVATGDVPRLRHVRPRVLLQQSEEGGRDALAPEGSRVGGRVAASRVCLAGKQRADAACERVCDGGAALEDDAAADASGGGRRPQRSLSRRPVARADQRELAEVLRGVDELREGGGGGRRAAESSVAGDAEVHQSEGPCADGEHGTTDARAQRRRVQFRRDSDELVDVPLGQIHLADRLQVEEAFGSHLQVHQGVLLVQGARQAYRVHE